MGHQRAYRAAVDGKRHDSKAGRIAGASRRDSAFDPDGRHVVCRRGRSAPASYAQSGPFTGLAGYWSGAGTVTLDDGSTERIRCRASYAVGDNGAGLNQTLVCASDSYKFDLKTNVIAERGALSGTWSESSRGVNGNIEGHGSSGNFQVVASAPGFTASISLTTRGNRQSVVIKSENGIPGRHHLADPLLRPVPAF